MPAIDAWRRAFQLGRLIIAPAADGCKHVQAPVGLNGTASQDLAGHQDC
jgi:hypothetical protein